jgi:hypothetical protein
MDASSFIFEVGHGYEIVSGKRTRNMDKLLIRNWEKEYKKVDEQNGEKFNLHH